ncbi:DUF1985 domain-containing protein, partial [Proteus mirabilis]|uniref:DUF1985 domain-containing protein n=1 Tax=Proteus mirabilis TaxID=584 RepID=UPI001C12FF9C
MKLLCDNESFKKYPWGRLSFERTLKSLHALADSTSEKGSAIYGFPYAILVWAFERIPFSTEKKI